MRLFLCEARERKRSILGVCEHFAIRRFVQKELIRTIFLQSGITINKKKEGGRVQTENNRKMCKHIKDKE